MNKLHRGGRIAAFQIAGGDVSADALAVGLKIKEQHRITGVKQKSGVIQQLQPIGADSVHQDDHPLAGLSGNQPAVMVAPLELGN